MAEHKWKTHGGFPTRYALSCGHRRTHETPEGIRIDYWVESPGEGSVHVRVHDHRTGTRVFWKAHRTCSEAKKVFRNATRGVYPSEE